MEVDPDSGIGIKKEAKTQPDHLFSKGKIGLEHALIAIFTFLALNIAAFSYINYQNYSKHFRGDFEATLATISDLKAKELSQYVAERIADGNILLARPTLYDSVKRLIQDPEDIKSKGFLEEWLGRYAEHYQYKDVRILDARRVQILSIPKMMSKPSQSLLGCLSGTLHATGPELIDFYRSENDGQIYISIALPVIDENPSAPPIGVVVMRIDPAKYIYPFINIWPVPSETAETLLVRRDGGDVVFLNDLRFRKNTTLNLRFSINKNKDLPAVKAVLGQVGIVSGRDYRGIPVVAYVRAIDGTPWFMVARLDKSEAYKPMRQQLFTIAWLALTSIVAFGTIIWYVWRRHNMLFYKQQYLSAQALKASEERYRKLFESSRDGMFLVDFETGSIINTNPFLTELLGYSRIELLKKHIWDVDVFKEIAASEADYRKLSEMEHVRFDDVLLRAKDGRVVNVEFTLSIYNADGKKIMQCDARDITQRKLVEAALEKGYEEFNLIFNAAPIMVFYKDGEGKFLRINKIFADNLGMPHQKILGKTVFEIYSEDIARQMANDDREVMCSGKPMLNIVEQHESKQGIRWVQTDKIPTFDSDGKVVGLIGFARDISELKLTQDELALAKETQYRTLIENLPQKVFLKDRNSVYISCNSHYAKDLKVKPEEVKGKTDYDFFPTYLAEKYREDDKRVMESGNTENIEEEFVVMKDFLRGAEKFIVNTVKIPVRDKGGNVTGLFGLFWDITDRKRVDEELRRAENMKISTDIKSKFTSMVSHELRSPMTVIKESINLILEGLVGSVTPEQKDILNTAKSNIDRLGRLINNVLDFQKIEYGKMVLDIKKCDLNEMVLTTSKEMNILAEEKGLGFTINIDESMPVVRLDKDKIVQVITNLLSNAIKFTEKGSIELSTEREDNMVHVTVRDTGSGIQADEMPRLFQTFEQLGGGLGKKRGGTGLGMAISKEIILAHNGKIWAESQFGKGSTFHFTLPIKERRG